MRRNDIANRLVMLVFGKTTAQRSLVGLFVAIALCAPALAEDWPQWRGPNCTGISQGDHPLPTKFSLTENLAWSVELGDSIASPVVADGRVFTTAMEGELPGNKFIVYGYDAATGKELWKREMEVKGEPLRNVHDANSYASATPAADAERVYVYFTRFGLMALDAKTGDTLWHRQLPDPYFVFDWGPGMSPVLHGDRLFFCQDDDLFPAMYCLDKKTGRIVWKDDRSDMACCYSHPVICETDNGPEVVVAGTGSLLGYDYNTGKRKWAAELFCRNVKTTPVSLNGVLYASVSSQGISYQWRATADADGDGKITREEIKTNKYRLNKDPIPDAFWKKFERGDVNNDGVLEGEEIDKAFLDPSNKGGLLAGEVQKRLGKFEDVQNLAEKVGEEGFEDLNSKQSVTYIQAVRGGGKGDVTETHMLWRHSPKAIDHIVSPLVLDGRMLLIKSGGIASCFETKAGKSIYRPGRIGNSSRHLASPVYGDGKIYVQGENGTIVVLKDGPKLKVLEKNELNETTAATPAIADGRIFIRTRGHLYCFAKKSR